MLKIYLHLTKDIKRSNISETKNLELAGVYAFEFKQ